MPLRRFAHFANNTAAAIASRAEITASQGGRMADKSTQLVLEALTRAVADPAGLPLHGNKTAPGLFAATGPAKVAAQRCKEENLLKVVRTETRGKTALEICTLTEKGLAYLLDQVSPKEVLEDLVRALEGRHAQLASLVAAAEQSRVALDALKSTVERVLAQVGTNGAPECPRPREVWQQFQANDGGKPERVEATETSPSVRPALTESEVDAAVMAPLQRWARSGATEDFPLPELYCRAIEALPHLSIGQFHDSLRRLHDYGHIYLHPWTGPLYVLPEPALALLVGHEVAFYASVRR